MALQRAIQLLKCETLFRQAICRHYFDAYRVVYNTVGVCDIKISCARRTCMKSNHSSSRVSPQHGVDFNIDNSVTNISKSKITDNPDLIEATPVSITSQLLHTGQLAHKSGTVEDDTSFAKVEFPPMYQLAPLIPESDILQKLLALGADLSVLEKKDVANDVLRMDFVKDVFPILQFLKDNDVNPDNFGKMINRCPQLLQTDIEEMKTVVSYLKSKKMKKDDIRYFLERQPALLCITTIDLDSKLGCYQQTFNLTGKELRATFHKLTRIISTPSYKIRDRAYYMEKNLGFSAADIKHMFILAPRIFVENLTLVANNCDYLHYVMGIPLSLVAKKPLVLRNNHTKLVARHRFLLYLGRAQYDPIKENYVSLDALVDPGDDVWCVSVAKASVLEYDKFMKTL